MEHNENRGKHKTVQNTSPTAKLMDPMIEPSQGKICNNIIRASKTSISSSTSTDYVFISKSFSITTCNQQQPTKNFSSSTEVFTEE